MSAWYSAHRRSASPEGVSRTPLVSRDAKAAEQKDRRARREVRNLQGSFHGLQRGCARPHRTQRYGRGVARRPPPEHPSSPSAVQSAKGVEEITSRPSTLITAGIPAS